MRFTLIRIVFPLVIVALCADVFAQEPATSTSNIPTLMVSGEGEVSAAPDMVILQLGVTSQQPTASAAQNQVNENMQKILDAVRDIGVPREQVQTTRVSLMPVYSNEVPRPLQDQSNQPKVVGFRANNSIRITLSDTSRAGEVLDSATRAGANQVEGIWFTLKNDKRQREEALRQAVRNASEKAAVMAAELNAQLGSVHMVTEEVTGFPRPHVMGRAMEMMATPVEPGEVQITARVNLTYRLIQQAAPENQRRQP